MTEDTFRIIFIGIPGVISIAAAIYGLVMVGRLDSDAKKWGEEMHLAKKRWDFRGRLLLAMSLRNLDDRDVARITGAPLYAVQGWLKGLVAPHPAMIEGILKDLKEKT